MDNDSKVRGYSEGETQFAYRGEWGGGLRGGNLTGDGVGPRQWWDSLGQL